eukprot:CAMPEP_0194329314 /NCGR_PEP_ID=MMETSP0171-20130528/47832_1 /TAXON_ID=218684 /ORGANISM="Corethron pennatum, Strain L29A3" /LENGTH=266 /DNA_ID=CAMNT_0039090007 /DNA_START=233 /DNA_END=1030 /DNA_ORIENTATION=+
MKKQLFLLSVASILSSPSLAVGIFSYKKNDSRGPSNWNEVDVEDNEWQAWKPLNVDKNECGSEENSQSPINLVKNHECRSDHEMNFDRGTCTLVDLFWEITPYSLKGTFPIENCRRPTVDISDSFHERYASSFELKVPSEHFMNGKQYDGELYFSHVDNVEEEHKENRDNQIAMTSVFLDASGDKFSAYMEKLIIGWKFARRRRNQNCRRKEQGRPKIPEMPILPPGSYDPSKYGVFYFHEVFKNKYYYGYRGSLTVPPCSDIVRW